MTDDARGDEAGVVTDEPDPLKAAEKRGYTKGYTAGQRRVIQAEEGEAAEARRLEFRRQAFLAALPAIMISGGWTRGGKATTTIDQYVSIAWDFADEAVKRAKL